jgi:hypothetical protein
MNDLVAHPQRRLTTVDTPSGLVEVLAPGACFADEDHFGPVPGLDEHSEAIKAEFGIARRASVN